MQHGSDQILIITIDGLRYALRLGLVECIVRAVYVIPVPTASDVVTGVINMAGELVPVLNVRNRLGLPARSINLSDQFVIIRSGRGLAALLVDSCLGVSDLRQHEPIPVFEMEDMISGEAPGTLHRAIARS